VEVGLSFLIGSQYLLNRFLGDGAGVWAGKLFPEAEGDGINVFEDDEHQMVNGEGDENVSRSVPFTVSVRPSVLNSIPVTTVSYSQDARWFFRTLYEEVVCLHDDLCIGDEFSLLFCLNERVRSWRIHVDGRDSEWVSIHVISRGKRATSRKGLFARWVVIFRSLVKT